MITARVLLDALLNKHWEDVCIPECKVGSTWLTTGCLRLDLWVMKKSWANPKTYCYEIKISRSDFVNDDKWQKYLEYCSDFYFVTPPGIIEPNELPPEAGLFVSTKNGTRLYCKKKAITREVKIPEDLFRYILMARTIIETERDYKGSKKALFETWLEEKKVNRELGWLVSKALREEIDKKILKVEEENERLLNQNKQYEEIKELLKKIGANPYDVLGWNGEDRFREILKNTELGIPEGFEYFLKDAIIKLQKVQEVLKNQGNECSTS